MTPKRKYKIYGMITITMMIMMMMMTMMMMMMMMMMMTMMKYFKREISTMWVMREVEVISVVVGALAAIPLGLNKSLHGNTRACVGHSGLGNARTLRRDLRDGQTIVTLGY